MFMGSKIGEDRQLRGKAANCGPFQNLYRHRALRDQIDAAVHIALTTSPNQGIGMVSEAAASGGGLHHGDSDVGVCQERFLVPRIFSPYVAGQTSVENPVVFTRGQRQ